MAVSFIWVLLASNTARAGQFKVSVTPSNTWCAAGPNGPFIVWNNDPPYFSFSCLGGFVVRGDPLGSACCGQAVSAWVNAPQGITITGAASAGSIFNLNNGSGWVGGSLFYGGGTNWISGTTSLGDPQFTSPYWGLTVQCAATCTGAGQITLASITLTASESQGPNLTAVGSGNLWYQTRSGEWIWNAPGNPWPVTLAGSDPSGVCSMSAFVGAHEVPGPSAVPDPSRWQQCPESTWTLSEGASVDTRDYISGAGPLPLTINATNAAQLTSSYSETLQVDNQPVNVSLSTPNDTNPSVWVNHAVTVNAAPSAGPSGVGGTNCGIDGGSAQSYAAHGVSVDGDGVHTVTCTAWNNSVGPQGQPNTGTSSVAVHIDEAPPSVSFEPQNPSDPTQLVVDTSDGESGVASGSLQIAPAGTGDWTSIPTSFDGSHLLARFDDSRLSGGYAFRATSCDNVGNCTSTSERLELPVRLASDSYVSLTKIVTPPRTRIVHERVRVGWHWVTVRRNHRLVRVKRGGHLEAITVIKVAKQCTTVRVRASRHRWRLRRICKAPQLRVTRTLGVRHGQPVTINGLDTTAQGVPLATRQVRIFAAPDNGSGSFSQLAVATTDAAGSWSAKLLPGPSRIIRAVTDGSSTILPSSGQVATIVPAEIKLLRVWPRHVAWGGTVHLVGQLLGGYLPRGGALVRLRIGYGSGYDTYGVQEHVTGNGRFSTTYTFGLGDPSIYRAYWFQIASLPMGNYPYAPAASRRVAVTVGGHPK